MKINKIDNKVMPTINLKPINNKDVKYIKGDRTNYYNTKQWKNLRLYYIKRHPLCECCLAHDVVSAATEVHHKRRILSGKTEEDRYELLTDESNLISLCYRCHDIMHNKMHKYNMDFCDELTDKEYLEGFDYLSYRK